MNNDISRQVIEICQDLDLEVRSYSGRGMYGDRCVGIDCDNPFQAFSRITLALMEQGSDGLEAVEHFTRDGAVTMDSMGLGSILYFPRLPWVGSEENVEEEEEETV